jgi:Domain of unknown function (DUF4926)
MPKINDTVRILKAIPSESLHEGALGVIVEEFTEPDEAYEVEFSDHNGSTVRQLALKPDQFVVIARRTGASRETSKE